MTLPTLVERELANLAGVDLRPGGDERFDGVAGEDEGRGTASADFARRLLRVAEFVTVGGFVLLVACAVLAAHFGGRSLHVHEIPFAGWGLAATVCSLTLARLNGDAYAPAIRPVRRKVLAAALLAGLIVSVTGAVANADGIAGPAWVLFLPVVLVTGAVTGPTSGLLVGTAAAAGVYSAAGLSHSLTTTGVGRLVVLLPAFPAVGWAAGALARLTRDATAEARERNAALEADVHELAAILDRVASGDLTVVPATGPQADPTITGVAVVFADALLALRRLVRQMDGVAGQLIDSAVDLARAAEEDASAVGAQVAAVSQTTSTIEELAATARGIAETTERVSQYAGNTRCDVDAAAAAVEASNDAFESIADRVGDLDRRAVQLRERIGRISSTTHAIDELARHTSILAVNASIEAARAGDHGRGFSNVASEVSVLAARAREATARIDAVVAALEAEAAATAGAARDGYDAVVVAAELQSDVVDALRRISGMVDRTTLAAREISEATRQQGVAADAVVGAMSTVTATGDQYRQGSARHADAAGRLRDLAAELSGALHRFKVG